MSHLDEIGIYHHLQNRSLFKNYDGWLPDFVGWGKTWCVLFWRLRGCTLPESNKAPKNRQSQRNFIFQPLIFKGYELLVSGRAVPNKNSQADFDRWVVATLLHPSSSALLRPSVFALAQTRSSARCENKLDIKKWKGGDQVVVFKNEWKKNVQSIAQLQFINYSWGQLMPRDPNPSISSSVLTFPRYQKNPAGFLNQILLNILPWQSTPNPCGTFRNNADFMGTHLQPGCSYSSWASRSNFSCKFALVDKVGFLRHTKMGGRPH